MHQVSQSKIMLKLNNQRLEAEKDKNKSLESELKTMAE